GFGPSGHLRPDRLWRVAHGDRSAPRAAQGGAVGRLGRAGPGRRGPRWLARRVARCAIATRGGVAACRMRLAMRTGEDTHQGGAQEMYELRNVAKTHRKGRATITALQDVNLSIADGEFLSIQGPTGQGKTTLLQLLGALDRPTSGSVLFDGLDLGRMREGQLTDVRRRAFGFVFQGFNLIPTLTAQENVETTLVPLRVPGTERRDRARGPLASAGLAA